MKQKKLLIFIWNLGIGGVQKRMKDVLIQINKDYSNWKVFLLVKHRKPDHFSREIKNLSNVEIIYFPVKHRIYTRWSSVVWMAKEYLRIKPDVCLTFMSHFSIFMVWLKKLLWWVKAKLVINEGVLTSGYLPIHSPRPEIDKWLVRLSYQQADKIIVPSKACRKDLIDNFWVPKSKIIVIPNWTMFKPVKSRNKNFDLIYIGRFAQEKNMFKLIELIKKISLEKLETRALFIGEGEMLVSMKNLINKLDLKKNILIKPSSSNFQRYLAESRYLITLSKNEGMPNVVLEAGMCKVPSIVANFKGSSEVVKHGHTGIILKKNKDENQLIKYLRNEGKRKIMGDNVFKLVQENFGEKNQERFITEMLEDE